MCMIAQKATIKSTKKLNHFLIKVFLSRNFQIPMQLFEQNLPKIEVFLKISRQKNTFIFLIGINWITKFEYLTTHVKSVKLSKIWDFCLRPKMDLNKRYLGSF